jgi:O-methyltransferase involved in polyketide biosynthesis
MMSEQNLTVRGVSDTARCALFRDPFAERLAGEHGLQLANNLVDGKKHWVARTWFDQFLSREFTREPTWWSISRRGWMRVPYRMDLPATLQWVEVDLPDIIAYKEEILANEQPRCRLERVALDLSGMAARQEFVCRARCAGDQGGDCE